MTAVTTEYPSLKPGSTARILYVNGSGTTSERTITVRSRYVASAGNTYLSAYCHLRTEDRTFRLDRVLGVLESDARHAGSYVDTEPAVRGNSPARQQRPRVTPPAKQGHLFRRLLLLAFLVYVFLLLFEQNLEFATIRAIVFPPARTAFEPTQAEGQPPPPPAPTDVSRTDVYRGQRFVVDRSPRVVSYTLMASGQQFSQMHALRVSVNESLLATAWGVRHPELTRMFGNADSNRDGWLSWEEIRQFQNWLYRSYRYMTNTTALRPEDFLAAGGGDCEDWAIMTAALLQFWGMHSRIGVVSSSTGHHAITLVPASNVPSTFMIIRNDLEHTNVTTRYTPIDYDNVGDLSNAVGRTFTLENVYDATEMFGRPF